MIIFQSINILLHIIVIKIMTNFIKFNIAKS